MDLRIAATPEQTAQNASRHLAKKLGELLQTQERASIALSGGSTPWATLRELATLELACERIDVYQVDERNAPDGDEERNWTHVNAVLLEPKNWPTERQHPMPVLDADRTAAATKYEDALPERLDLVVLGLGTDGHTASLIPGDPVCEVTGSRVAWTTNEERGHHRMTLTFEEFDRVGELVWLVTGAKKAEMLSRLLDSDPSIPAGKLPPVNATVFADTAAADS